MSESSIDLVAIACVVDSSLLLASEWSRVLIDYVGPLLKRLTELYPSHQFRLAFVTYGAADTRPEPLLSKRFFSPLSQFAKELSDSPSKLGIGQTNSGSGRGLSALEGFVAAIELFDILMASTNFTVSPQKESRSLISHLLHIAASPPDVAQRPHCNMLQHLDSVNWESMPAELKKRKINLSLISLRKIPQFQELQSLVAGPGAQSPWFNVRAPHTLALAGFPVPPKTGTKRQTEVPPTDQSPDPKRQKVAADTVAKASPPSPALSPARSPARPPQNRSQPAAPVPQPPPTAVVPAQNSSPAQPTPSVPLSTPVAPSSSTPLPPPAPPQALDPVIAQNRMRFIQMMSRVKAMDKEIEDMDAQISNARSAGQAANTAELQKKRDNAAEMNEKLKAALRMQLQKWKGALPAQAGAAGSALQNGLAEAGPSTQSHSSNASGASGEHPVRPQMSEQKYVTSESQITTQLWQARHGGATSAPGSATPQAPTGQPQSLSTLTPEAATQMQKLIEQKGTQLPNLAPLQSGMIPQETSGAPNVPNTSWQGTFSMAVPNFGGQELQIHVIGNVQAQSVPVDNWPKNFILKACKEPLKDMQELISWLKPYQSRTCAMQFKPNPRAPDGLMNVQKFQALYKFMSETLIYAYTGPQLPNGKFLYNILIFALKSSLAGVVFLDGGLPDLPGNGNILDSPLPSGTLNLPPQLRARMQTLEPAKQRELLAHLALRQRQQLQQAQQLSTAFAPANSHGLPMPYRTATTVSQGVPSNAVFNMPANAGAGGINYEMMQSFMQRKAEGSASQGANPG